VPLHKVLRHFLHGHYLAFGIEDLDPELLCLPLPSWHLLRKHDARRWIKAGAGA